MGLRGATGLDREALHRRGHPVHQEDPRHPEGARHAEVEEIPESQIRRAGRWGGDAIGVYLEGIPRVFMRKMAGFPEEAGSFYLPRAEVEPPPALTREIYPEVDEWLAEMEAFRPGSAHNEVEAPPGPPDRLPPGFGHPPPALPGPPDMEGRRPRHGRLPGLCHPGHGRLLLALLRTILSHR
jgi:hypothetical protein